nr:hypothetical protein [Tanacetum cinerariifolium]
MRNLVFADLRRIILRTMKRSANLNSSGLSFLLAVGTFFTGSGNFFWRTSTPTRSSGHKESSSLYDELGLTDSEEESEEDVPGADAGGQGKGQAGQDPGAQAEGQAGPDPDRKHIDLDVTDVLTQPPPEQMDEGDKPSKANNEKATAETKAKSMVSVTIQQYMSSIPPMTTPIIDLTSRPESPKVHQQLKATAIETTTTTTTILPPLSRQQQSTTDAMMMKRISDLEHIIENLIQENKKLEQRLDSHGARLYTLEKLDIPHQVSKVVDEVVTDAIDWAMQAPLRNRFRDFPEADMKEILHQRMWEIDSYKSDEDHKQLYEALEKSMNRDNSEELAKDLAEARKKKKKSVKSPKTPPGSPPHQPPPPPPPAGPSRASGSPRAFGSSQVPPPPPPPSTNQKDIQMNDDMAPDEQAQSFDDEDIESAHILSMDDSIQRHNVSKPLPLGGPPGQVKIQFDFFFNKDLEYLRYGSKGSRPALSISKIKAACYPDVGLEQMMPDQIWSEEECKYDIASMYGISHWWFQRQQFYIDRHTFEGDRRAVRTHMQILSVFRIKVFFMCGYDYMKKIVLRRADLNKHVIVKRDFKYLYPSDFEDMYLLNLQEDFHSYQTQLNLTKPRWDATGFEYKHDYTVINSPRAIDEALDYRVKEFKINRMNLGMNTRFWTRKDVDRSKAFMFAIHKRLKTRRIFRNLESFVGKRVRDGDYRLLKRTE